MNNLHSDLIGTVQDQSRTMRKVLILLKKGFSSQESAVGSGRSLHHHVEQAIDILEIALNSEDAAKADKILASKSLDGGEWGGLLSLLVAKHGLAAFSAEEHKGKKGCLDYLLSARVHADRSATAKAGDNLGESASAVASIDVDIGSVRRLMDAAEVARLAAQGQNGTALN